MGKTKVTLAVDEELLRESKAYLVEKNLTVSGTLEKALSELAASGLVEKVVAIPERSSDTSDTTKFRESGPRGRTLRLLPSCENLLAVERPDAQEEQRDIEQ